MRLGLLGALALGTMTLVGCGSDDGDVDTPSIDSVLPGDSVLSGDSDVTDSTMVDDSMTTDPMTTDSLP